MTWRFRCRRCWPDFPAVASALADLGTGMAGLDGSELGDDVLDGHARGEYGDRLWRRRRRLRRALGGLAPCLADRIDAFSPPRPGRARAASFPGAVEAARAAGRVPGRAHAFRAHAGEPSTTRHSATAQYLRNSLTGSCQLSCTVWTRLAVVKLRPHGTGARMRSRRAWICSMGRHPGQCNFPRTGMGAEVPRPGRDQPRHRDRLSGAGHGTAARANREDRPASSCSNSPPTLTTGSTGCSSPTLSGHSPRSPTPRSLNTAPNPA
jgi:hypothetical protein